MDTIQRANRLTGQRANRLTASHVVAGLTRPFIHEPEPRSLKNIHGTIWVDKEAGLF